MSRRALARLERFRGMPAQVSELYAERAAEIRRAHAAGASVSAIARTLGVDRKIVYDALNGQKGKP